MIVSVFLMICLEISPKSCDNRIREGGQLMTELYLMRHGQTRFNLQGRVQGPVIPP